MAIRIRSLPKGSISFVNVRPEKYIGTVDKEPSSHKSPGKYKPSKVLLLHLSKSFHLLKSSQSFFTKILSCMLIIINMDYVYNLSIYSFNGSVCFDLLKVT